MSTPSTISRRSSTKTIVVGVAALLLVVIVGWFVLGFGSEEPRLNEPTPVLAKFVSTRAFDALPYDKQRQYYLMLDNRGKEIEQSYKSGQISEGEYRTALDAAWLGKHIDRIEKYASLPAGTARAKYIDELLVKKLEKDAKKAEKGAKTKGAEEKINEDEAAAEMRVESWPAPVREQWRLFHDAYRREKKAREAAATQSAAEP